jgi:hypothetical protein
MTEFSQACSNCGRIRCNECPELKKHGSLLLPIFKVIKDEAN